MKLVLMAKRKEDIDYERLWLILAGLALIAFPVLSKNQGLRMLCPFRAMTGIPCPTCGMTRLLFALIHLNLREAFLYNPFMTVCYFFIAAFLLYALTAVLLGTRRIRTDPHDRTLGVPARISFFLLLFSNWVYLMFRGG